MTSIDEIVSQLPEPLRREVEDFARSLLEGQARRNVGPLPGRWAGALREYRDQYRSLDLQRKALEWWGD